MSRKSQAKHSIFVANAKKGGARITKIQSKLIGDRFVDWCFKNNYIFNSIADVSLEMLQNYFKSLQAEKISTATQHNRLSSIRRAMKSLKSDPNAKGITANAVGIPPRCRSGTKMPLPDVLFESILMKATELNEPGFVIALRLQRLLGYRGLESMMSILDLEKYALEAADFLKVPVIRGTKGGRPRTSVIIQSRAIDTLDVIRSALLYMQEHGGYLIECGKAGLKSALAKYHRLAKKVGLVGTYAPHSLRYAYCIDKLIEMRDAGYNRKEAMAFAANILGHGDSRGRYVSQVYGKTVVHTLPVEKRKSRLDRAIKKLDQLISIIDENTSRSDT